MRTPSLAIVFLSLFALVQCLNNHPIIGILTQPYAGSSSACYIAASYVKFIESAGARVVPIFHDSPQSELLRIFNSVNGILFPGGGSDLQNTPLYNAASYLYSLAIKANDNNDYFPMEGHCMGFEALSMITSQNISILQRVELENVSVALKFTNGSEKSKLFLDAPKEILKILSTESVTLNNHHYGIPPEVFAGNQYLSNFYNVLSYNTDINGITFVSTMEGIDYPVFALQWHAEKPLFEWNTWEDINHSSNSVKAMQYIADHFVAEARKNNHSFASHADEMAALIYNYPVTYSGLKDGDFVQTYIFNS